MPANTNGHLWIFCLNVGQGDTTIVISPGNQVLIFDAVRETKIISLLEDLNVQSTDPIHQIVVSHPHIDHYRGVEGLLNNYSQVGGLTLTSLRHFTNPKAGYISIINTALTNNVPIRFQSGYDQFYPDQNPIADPSTMIVELLGPSNQFIEQLFVSGKLNTNHYSIIARLNWQGFRMVIPGDAQMETWAHFDSEQMMRDSCAVLRAAHHGSANGTQFERIDRLNPRLIVVSSDPSGKDNIPDLIGAAVFSRYASRSSQPLVAMTDNRDQTKTGSIKIDVRPSGRFDVFRYGDARDEDIDFLNETTLDFGNNPTLWQDLTRSKLP